MLTTIVILFVSGLFAGAINAVAGGGTFLTFGALTLVGVPPITANATSSITQFPGYVTSTLAYWSDIKRIWRSAIALAVASAIGSTLGALILISMDNPQFRALVPWLLLAATALFAAGPLLKPKPRPVVEGATGATRPSVNVKSPLVQLFTAIYGGFFGAGMGIMMLATLGLTERGDYHHLNALKNMLAMVIALVAILVFVVGGAVAWWEAAFMAPGVALGGYGGVWLARRVPQTLVRGIVIVVGLGLAIYYFATA